MEEPQCFSSLHLQPLSMPESRENTFVDRTYVLTNYGLSIPLSIYAVRSWDNFKAGGGGTKGHPSHHGVAKSEILRLSQD